MVLFIRSIVITLSLTDFTVPVSVLTDAPLGAGVAVELPGADGDAEPVAAGCDAEGEGVAVAGGLPVVPPQPASAAVSSTAVRSTAAYRVTACRVTVGRNAVFLMRVYTYISKFVNPGDD